MAEHVLVPWDDGHRPGGTKQATQMALNTSKKRSKFLSVYDDLLSDHWRDKAYEFACSRGRPWGAYITKEELLAGSDCALELLKDNPEKAIALATSYALCNVAPFVLEDAIHGVAVWCLISTASKAVDYHIDYAELYRYETNIIHPPLYAGTVQVSPLSCGDMMGGDFCVNTDGLEHYRRFGYKGRLQTPESLESDFSTGNWLTIKYRRNRAILHDGDYPHYSSRIIHIPDDKKRVILGFNFFSSAVGECSERAPEHSDAFNRTVKLYQMMSKLGAPVANGETSTEVATDNDNHYELELRRPNHTKLSIQDIKKNPALKKLLVKAAKLKKDNEQKIDNCP